MTEARRCPECGAELPADAPEGLCPQCLLRQGLNPSAAGPGPSTAGYRASFTAPTPAELARHFPQLEVLELLGQGGMGAVYRARQVKLDRLVALKILPPEVAQDPAFAERFAREARALAKLNHPNIVAVHDFGESDGLFYFLMEYVDGANLRQLLEGSKLKPEEALRIVPQLCDALQYAHEEGIVHRDIKPENILLDRRGRVKIADFGLAKLLGRPPGVLTLTGSRQVMGTPHYMAPEQVERPQEVDHRADIYSLGVVFYEMLTGRLPLGRFELPSQKVHVDVRLDDVVLRALEREPERRYQHVSDVKTDVESIANTPEPPARPPAGPGRNPTVDELLQKPWPVKRLLACALVVVACFMPWANLSFPFQGILEVPLGPATVSITGWNSNLTLGGLTIPNWLVGVAGAAAAVFLVLQTLGVYPSRWAVPLLALYGLGHMTVFCAIVVARSGALGIGPVFIVGALVGVLVGSLRPLLASGPRRLRLGLTMLDWAILMCYFGGVFTVLPWVKVVATSYDPDGKNLVTSAALSIVGVGQGTAIALGWAAAGALLLAARLWQRLRPAWPWILAPAALGLLLGTGLFLEVFLDSATGLLASLIQPHWPRSQLTSLRIDQVLPFPFIVLALAFTLYCLAMVGLGKRWRGGRSPNTSATAASPPDRS